MISQQLLKQNQNQKSISELQKTFDTHQRNRCNRKRRVTVAAGTERLKLAPLDTQRQPSGTGSELDQLRLEVAAAGTLRLHSDE